MPGIRGRSVPLAGRAAACRRKRVRAAAQEVAADTPARRDAPRLGATAHPKRARLPGSAHPPGELTAVSLRGESRMAGGGRPGARLHVVAVDVEDGRVERLGHVRAVRAGAALARVGREGHLRAAAGLQGYTLPYNRGRACVRAARPPRPPGAATSQRPGMARCPAAATYADQARRAARAAARPSAADARTGPARRQDRVRLGAGRPAACEARHSVRPRAGQRWIVAQTGRAPGGGTPGC